MQQSHIYIYICVSYIYKILTFLYFVYTGSLQKILLLPALHLSLCMVLVNRCLSLTWFVPKFNLFCLFIHTHTHTHTNHTFHMLFYWLNFTWVQYKFCENYKHKWVCWKMCWKQTVSELSQKIIKQGTTKSLYTLNICWGSHHQAFIMRWFSINGVLGLYLQFLVLM